MNSDKSGGHDAARREAGSPMSGEARVLKKPLSAVAGLLGAALCSSATLAATRISDICVNAVDRAALQAVARTLPIGQTTVYGRPFMAEPSVLRTEVEVFGPQTLLYEVDVTIDGACDVLAASTRLENNPERAW